MLASSTVQLPSIGASDLDMRSMFAQEHIVIALRPLSRCALRSLMWYCLPVASCCW